MRVIITGGSGLIGTVLTNMLAGNENEVVVLSRNPQRVTGLPEGASAVHWDGRTAEGWGHLAEGAAIINLAGENLSQGRLNQERKRRIRDSRLNAGKAVTEAVQAVTEKPRVLIQASAVGYYGSHGDDELDESSPPGSDFLAKVCLGWESSTAAVEAMGVRRVVIRSAPVLSHGEGVLPQMMLPFRFFIGGKLGSGRQWFPWIHIADEAAAIRFLLENELASGEFNLVSPHAVTNAQLSRVLGRVMHRPALMPAPAILLRLVLGEMGIVVLGSERVRPKKLLDMGFDFRYTELEVALRDLLT